MKITSLIVSLFLLGAVLASTALASDATNSSAASLSDGMAVDGVSSLNEVQPQEMVGIPGVSTNYYVQCFNRPPYCPRGERAVRCPYNRYLWTCRHWR